MCQNGKCVRMENVSEWKMCQNRKLENLLSFRDPFWHFNLCLANHVPIREIPTLSYILTLSRSPSCLNTHPPTWIGCGRPLVAGVVSSSSPASCVVIVGCNLVVEIDSVLIVVGGEEVGCEEFVLPASLAPSTVLLAGDRDVKVVLVELVKLDGHTKKMKSFIPRKFRILFFALEGFWGQHLGAKFPVSPEQPCGLFALIALQPHSPLSGKLCPSVNWLCSRCLTSVIVREPISPSWHQPLTF